MTENILKLLQLCNKLKGEDFEIENGDFMISLRGGTFRFYSFVERLNYVDIRPGDAIEFSEHFLYFPESLNYCVFMWEKMANEFKVIEDGE